MARWSWSVDEKWEGLHFKRGREGWIFRSPISWTFGLGPHRHYLVSEAQKDELVRALSVPSWGSFAILIAAALLGVAPLVVVVWWFPALVKLAITGTWHVYLMGIFMALWFQGIMNTYFWLKIRSTLAGATRTAERIGFVERLDAHAAVTPLGSVLLVTLLSIAMIGYSTYDLLNSKTWIHSQIIAVFLFGFLATYFLAVLKLKLKSNRNSRGRVG